MSPQRVARRGQRGFTLLEVLIALVVSTLIIVPTLAWITMTYRQNAAQTNSARADTLGSLTRLAFSRDVASANDVSLDAHDCASESPVSVASTPDASPDAGLAAVSPDTDPPTTAPPSTVPSTTAPPATVPPAVVSPDEATPVIEFGYEDNGTGASRTVYVVHIEGGQANGGVGSGARGTLVRRRCDATGLLVSSSELGEGLIEPAAGWASIASCAPRSGYPLDDCGRVTLRLPSRDRTDVLVANLRSGPPR